ncbi:MAG TPA: hypothetical protein DHI91_01615 [Candidatus Portnoybacteria bacterium]|nr:hypothetical protein [Candidatus Portnoybacteria bacterium]
MPTNEKLYQEQLEKNRARQTGAPQGQESVSFPWLMLCVAIIFDLIGLIPIVNFITETLAGLIFGLWQKSYSPQTDPIITFFVAKIIDTISAGILPSNIGIVVYAYMKKKAVNIKEKLTPLANSRLGQLAIKNIDSRYPS